MTNSDFLIPIAVFLASIIGGFTVYEYSAWRTERRLKKWIKKYELEDVTKILKEIKKALIGE